MDEYGQALVMDIVTVVLCSGLLFRFANLRFSHPGTPYIIFHIHTVTTRLTGLINGAPTLYTNSPGLFEPVMPEEIVRAALYCDIGFWAVTATWILMNVIPQKPRPPQARVILLEPRLLRPILLFAFVMGVVGLRVAATIPGVAVYDGLDPNSAWSSSSYLIILPSWFGLAVLGHIYYYGYRRLSVVLLAFYLVLMSVQGGMRFRVIIGVILAVQIWVEQRDRRWPSKGLLAALAVAALAFFPMKTIGLLVQQGASPTEVTDAVTDSVSDMSEGAAADQMFLDEFGSALTLIDRQNHKYMGSMYLPVLTLPIPRALWPEKPVLSGFVTDISSAHRPMAASGMITTYLGEAYANFGLAGIFLVPPLLAVGLAWFYRKAYTVPRLSLLRFTYVLVSVNLIQIYRDGLLSIIVFTMVNMMPLSIIVIAHLLSEGVRKRRHLGLAAATDINPIAASSNRPV